MWRTWGYSSSVRSTCYSSRRFWAPTKQLTTNRNSSSMASSAPFWPAHMCTDMLTGKTPIHINKNISKKNLWIGAVCEGACCLAWWSKSRPRSHKGEGEKWLLPVVLWPLTMCHNICMPAHIGVDDCPPSKATAILGMVHLMQKDYLIWTWLFTSLMEGWGGVTGPLPEYPITCYHLFYAILFEGEARLHGLEKSRGWGTSMQLWGSTHSFWVQTFQVCEEGHPYLCR